MFSRILRSFALSAAIVTAGVAAIVATPNTANAVPMTANAVTATVEGGEWVQYKMDLTDGEEIEIEVSPKGGDLVLEVYGPSGSRVGEKHVCKAGKKTTVTVSVAKSGAWKFRLSNFGDEAVKFTLAAN